MKLETIELPCFDYFVNEAWKKLRSPRNRLRIDSRIIDNEEASLPQEIPNKCGIYARWVNDELKYIGTVRKKQGLRGRLTQHLIKCPEKTQSKLELVKESMDNEHKIDVSFIIVKPEPFRLALEDELIRKARTKGLVAWNYKSIR